MIWKIAGFLLLVVMAIGANYYAPAPVSAAFFIATLVAYFRSTHEGFWLAFFLVTADGFFGFFGLYEALLTVIPGLPGIEVSQLYILLSVVKASRKKAADPPFYAPYLSVLFVYLLFLIFQGYVIGVSSAMNVQFRLVKLITPLLLFYSLPRLIQNKEGYAECFRYLFPVAFVALLAQVFTITYGRSPAQYFGVNQEVWFAIEMTEEKTYRGFYSESIVLITYFGALFFAAFRTKYFSTPYLYAVIIANYLSFFLSATRGWVLGFTFILLLYAVFVMKFSIRRLAYISIVGAGVYLLVLKAAPIVSVQMHNAFLRIMTLESLAKGDATAGGTLIRLTERGPRVLHKWKDAPLTGWGFSDDFFDYQDEHVGNQNILLHSGIVGALLMAMFFMFFLSRIYLRSTRLPPDHPAKTALPVFIIFFLGWFIIHSTSGQYFSYHQNHPNREIIIALFFSFGAMIYKEALPPGQPQETANKSSVAIWN